MTLIEIVICTVLLLMAVPDVCKKLQRQGLIYVVYAIAGVALSAFMTPQTWPVLDQVGAFGFILLLFIIGLEIDLPPPRKALRALLFAISWTAIQLPVLLLLTYFLELDWKEISICVVALTGCSVGIGYNCWMHYSGISHEHKQAWLFWMVALEVLAILFLSMISHSDSEATMNDIFLRILGILLLVLVIAISSRKITHFLQWLMDHTVQWKAHFIALFIFIIAAMGNRIGLSAPKTAFFLGLFMHSATCEGMGLEHYLRPIAQHLLIPVFFVGLGGMIRMEMVFSIVGLWSFLSALLLIAIREISYRRVFQKYMPGDQRAFLLLCPNLTMVAVAANAWGFSEFNKGGIWMLLTGLWMTLFSVMLLPKDQPASSLHHIKNQLPQKIL